MRRRGFHLLCGSGERRAAAASLSSTHCFIQQLESCIDKKSLAEGKKVHSEIRRLGLLEDGSLGVSIVRMYIKCKSNKDARLVFEQMADRSMVLWTSMVAAHVAVGDSAAGWSFFHRMQLEGILPDKVTFVSILNACDSWACIRGGRSVHQLVVERGMESNVAVANAVIKMYGKCSCMESAVAVFEQMPHRDVTSWTGMITTYALNGQLQNAFSYFLRMALEGVKPNNITFLAALGVCMTMEQGRLVHSCIVEADWEDENMVANAIINMYSKCGSLDEARNMFSRMKHWNVATWNAMISACTQHGFSAEALELFNQMQVEQVVPNSVTFTSILGACASPEDLAEGRQLHSCISRLGLDTDVVVGTALVNMYCKCNSLAEARAAFHCIDHKNIISWNTLIAGYARDEDAGQRGRALDLYRQMLSLGIRPTKTTFINVLNSVDFLPEGRQVHTCVEECSICVSDVFMGNALINMYGKCGSVVDVTEIFHRMPDKDAITWNGLLAACVEHGQYEKAVIEFNKMQLDGILANRATFLVMVSAFSTKAGLVAARRLHPLLTESGYEAEVVVGNAIISMYNKCCSLVDARSKFDSMPERSVVSWTSIITACSQHGFHDEAIQLFHKMDLEPDKVCFIAAIEACALGSSKQREGMMIHSRVQESGLETDIFVGTALLHMYSKYGNMIDADLVFRKLPSRTVPCWNAMIGGYAQNGHMTQAREVFWEMQQDGTLPDHITFLGVVSACGHAGLVESGLRTFASMGTDYGTVPTLENYGCLIDLLGRAGQLDEAGEFLKGMPCTPSGVTWKALLAACKVHGDVGRGKNVANQVLKMEPQSAAAHIEFYKMCISDCDQHGESDQQLGPLL